MAVLLHTEKMEIPSTKTCTKCKTEKSVIDFHTCQSGARRVPQAVCKPCRSIDSKLKYQKDKDRIIRVSLAWHNKNKERCAIVAKEYINKNREKYNARKRAYIRRKYKENISYRITFALRSRLQKAITHGQGFKRLSSVKLLGIGFDDVRNHLQGMFTGEMSWDNYGALWHIDHHIPCAAWNMKNEHHQLACFNWRNLKPMLKRENRVKHDTLPEGWQDYMAMLLRVTGAPVPPLQPVAIQ
jgi:hypothetical protein